MRLDYFRSVHLKSVTWGCAQYNLSRFDFNLWLFYNFSEWIWHLGHLASKQMGPNNSISYCWVWRCTNHSYTTSKWLCKFWVWGRQWTHLLWFSQLSYPRFSHKCPTNIISLTFAEPDKTCYFINFAKLNWTTHLHYTVSVPWHNFK
jgi:hypothetical protein